MDDAPKKGLDAFGLGDKPEIKVALWLEKELEDAKKDEDKTEADDDKKDEDEKPKEVKKWQVGIALGSFSNLEKNRRYAKLTDQPWIVEIDQADFEKIKPDLRALRDKSVVAVDVSKADRIELSIGEEKAVLEKGAFWKMLEPLEAKVAFTAVSGFLTKLKDLKAMDFVAADKAGEDTNLDKPRMTIRLHVPGQVAPVVVTIGGKSPSGATTFVRSGDSASIAVVSTEDVEPVLVRPLWFRARDIWQFKQNDAVAATVERRDGPTVKLTKVDGEWKMVAPIGAPADRTNAKQLISDLFKLHAKQYVAKGDLATYGLDNPEIKVSITVQPKPKKPKSKPATTKAASQPTTTEAAATKAAPETYTLWASAAKEKDTAYGRLPNNDYVFELGKSLFESISAEMHQRKLFEGLETDDAGYLSIESTGTKRDFRKTDDKWALANDKYFRVEEKKVKAALSDLKSLKAQRYVAYKDVDLAKYGLDKPACVIKVKAGTFARELHLSDKEESGQKYACWAGTDKVFLVDPEDINDVDIPLTDFQDKGKDKGKDEGKKKK